jgi:hypothetical protein
MAKLSNAWNLTKHIGADVKYYENCESSTKIYKFELILYIINNIVDTKNIWNIFIKYKIFINLYTNKLYIIHQIKILL